MRPDGADVGGEKCTRATVSEAFTYPKGTKRFSLVARISAEAPGKMAHCEAIQEELGSTLDAGYLLADADADLTITSDEFNDWWEMECLETPDYTLRDLVFTALDDREPDVLGRSLRGDAQLSIGVFYHLNWGWRDFIAPGADGRWAYPWRQVISDEA